MKNLHFPRLLQCYTCIGYTQRFSSAEIGGFFSIVIQCSFSSVGSDIFGTGQLIHMNIYVMLTFLQPYISVSVGFNCAPAALL